MNVARVNARAVLLANGTLLTMGGCINRDCQGSTMAGGKSITQPREQRRTVLTFHKKNGHTESSPILFSLNGEGLPHLQAAPFLGN